MDTNRIKLKQTSSNQCVYVLPPEWNKTASTLFATIVIIFFVVFAYVFVVLDDTRISITILGIVPTIVLGYWYYEYATEMKITISDASFSMDRIFYTYHKILIPLEEIDSFEYSKISTLPNFRMRDIRSYKSLFSGYKASFGSFSAKEGLLLVNQNGERFIVTDSLTTNEIYWFADELNRHISK